MSTAQLNDNSHSATSFSHPPLARYPFHQQAARTWTSASPFPLLTYGVDSYSSVSSGFKPEYIMFDRQDDPGSRWTGLMSGAQPLNPSTPAAGKASAPVAASTSTSPFSPLDQFFPPPVPSESQADPLFPEDRQWICIQLDRLALVDTITFGKTNKPHPCNTKEVDVFYSTDKQHWVHGLRASLKNNTEYETFKLKNPSGGQVLPCRYIKVVPISSHSLNYNTSIWYLAVQGNANEEAVEQAWHKLAAHKERKTLTLMLKHLRQRGLMSEFHALKSRVAHPPLDIAFEHPLITALHQHLVSKGDFDGAEQCLANCAHAGLLDAVLARAPPRLQWKRLSQEHHRHHPCGMSSPDGDCPSARSGHQMVFVPADLKATADDDSNNGRPALYLYGGFDGEEDLDDFWRLDLGDTPSWGARRWIRLNPQYGPGPRSCHQMCVDGKTGMIYLMGHFRPCDNSEHDDEEPNDLWAYHTRGEKQGQFELLDADARRNGGPKLVHDLQMVVDEEGGGIWVFGGRHSNQPDLEADQSWSGLYRYNIQKRTWTLLRNDTSLNVAASGELRSRHGHAMIFDPRQRKLIIFGGQRDQVALDDLWTYSVDNKEPLLLSSNASADGGPAPYFTHRGVYDPLRHQLRFLAGHPSASSSVFKVEESQPEAWRWSSSFHIFDIAQEKWTVVESDLAAAARDEIPKARFAHQLVYDPESETHYLFGGVEEPYMSMDSQESPSQRLGDLWSMNLERPSRDDLLRQARLLIRKQKFLELCQTDSVSALSYLKKEIGDLVVFDAATQAQDPVARQVYRDCLNHLLSAPSSSSGQFHSASTIDAGLIATSKLATLSSAGGTLRWEQRTQTFSKLLRLFPANLQEPIDNLIDLATA